MLVMTIKDRQMSGYFAHVYEYAAVSKYVKNVWDNTWISLLPLACDRSARYLMNMAVAASLQQVDQLANPVVFGDPLLVDKKLSSLMGLGGSEGWSVMSRMQEGVWIRIWGSAFEGRAGSCECSDGKQLQSDDSATVLSHAVQVLYGGGVGEVEEAVYVGIGGEEGIPNGSG